MPVVVTKELAVQMVQAQLAEIRRVIPNYPELAIVRVTEYAVGWLITYQSAEYVRTGVFTTALVGNGPYLVDRYDGSMHRVPVTTLGVNWQEMYLEQVKGITPPDPLLLAVRDIARRDGAVAAMRHLRRKAPRFTAQEAKEYVDAVRNGQEPAAELTRRTRTPRTWEDALSFDTVSGPLDP